VVSWLDDHARSDLEELTIKIKHGARDSEEDDLQHHDILYLVLNALLILQLKLINSARARSMLARAWHSS
jgi:hypothetical protein